MLLVILLLVPVLTALAQDPIINTQYGPIRGTIRNLNGNEFSVFLGIPYAKPPVGDLRFKPAQQHDGWIGEELNATVTPPICPQEPGFVWIDPATPNAFQNSDVAGESEDCLTLDIYVTGDVSASSRTPLPVLVYIHGGGFTIGGSDSAIGDALVTEGEPIVLVSIQYRLSLLGFLTSGDDLMPGNLGLKDQSFALRWVKENIAQFLGNPDAVTISGVSAGAESVLAHMISPLSSGLFIKAISQSSPTARVYQRSEQSRPFFLMLAESLQCFGSTEMIVECLRSKSWQALLNARVDLNQYLSLRVVDGEFITDEPRHLWSNGQFNDAELMVGFTSDDGTILLGAFPTVNFTTDRSLDLTILQSTVFSLVQLQTATYPPIDAITYYGQPLLNFEDLYTVIKGRYYDAYSTPLEKARGILNLFTDNIFITHALFAARNVEQRKGKFHVYFFDHRTELLGLSGSGELELKAPHTAELPYLFGYGLTHPDEIAMTPDEIVLTRSVIKAWTSYVSGSAVYLDMDGNEHEWIESTDAVPKTLIFNTLMSADSISSSDQWKSGLDFWLAIDSLADFGNEAEATTPPVPDPSLGITVLPSMVGIAIALVIGIFSVRAVVV